MANRLDQTYYYDQQIRRYIMQFMAVFSVFKVKIGRTDERDEKLISVPVHYSSQDRVVSSILANNTQNTPIRLPAMAVYMRDISRAPDRKTGTAFERRNVYTPVGGLVPDDMVVVHQRMPVPYDLHMEVSIYSSNMDQHAQILEQILPLFDPQLDIQTSDSVFDWTRLTSIHLDTIMTDDLRAQELAGRAVMTTLAFDLPIWLDFPAEVKKDFVAKIFTRVGMVSSSAVMSSDADIIQELDDAGYDYTKWFDANDLPFD